MSVKSRDPCESALEACGGMRMRLWLSVTVLLWGFLPSTPHQPLLRETMNALLFQSTTVVRIPSSNRAVVPETVMAPSSDHHGGWVNDILIQLSMSCTSQSYDAVHPSPQDSRSGGVLSGYWDHSIRAWLAKSLLHISSNRQVHQTPSSWVQGVVVILL